MEWLIMILCIATIVLGSVELSSILSKLSFSYWVHKIVIVLACTILIALIAVSVYVFGVVVIV